jgi:hypothetical protein
VSDSDHGEQEELALWMLSTAWKHDLDHDLTSPLGMFAVHCAGIALEMRNHTEWLPIEATQFTDDDGKVGRAEAFAEINQLLPTIQYKGIIYMTPLDSFIAGAAGKRLTYERLVA